MAIRKSGFVALLDVLGFSERVLRDALGSLDAYIETVLRITAPNRGLGTILFSDTVVVYSFDDSDDSFHAIIGVYSNLLHDLTLAGVAVRGAVSHGDFVRSEHNSHGTVLAGRPIIDAHHYESRLQWIGIMLAPSVLERRQDVSLNHCALSVTAALPDGPEQFVDALSRLMIQPCAAIPLEDASGRTTEFEGFAIVPISVKAERLRDLRDSIDNVRRRVERLKQLAPEARSQASTNTL
jgi:hypothetical protein